MKLEEGGFLPPVPRPLLPSKQSLLPSAPSCSFLVKVPILGPRHHKIGCDSPLKYRYWRKDLSAGTTGVPDRAAEGVVKCYDLLGESQTQGGDLWYSGPGEHVEPCLVVSPDVKLSALGGGGLA